MIKLSEFISKEFQPSEKVKAKNYLKRGSRDQENVFKEPSIYEEPLEPNGRPENRNTNTAFNKGFPWDFEDPSGIFEDFQDDEYELEFELTPWEALQGSVEFTLKKQYGIKDEGFYNLILEAGGSRETNKKKKQGIHIAEYYVSLLKNEGYEDLEDLVEVVGDRLPVDFEQMSERDRIDELVLALCVDSAYGIVSLTVSDYILLDIRKEDVGLDGNKQVVNKLGATGLTAFSQNEAGRFQEIAGISSESVKLDKIHQALIGREFQTLQDVKKMCSRLRQSGFVQSDIEEFIRTYII